jgi:hypothetical protein
MSMAGDYTQPGTIDDWILHSQQLHFLPVGSASLSN